MKAEIRNIRLPYGQSFEFASKCKYLIRTPCKSYDYSTISTICVLENREGLNLSHSTHVASGTTNCNHRHVYPAGPDVHKQETTSPQGSKILL